MLWCYKFVVLFTDELSDKSRSGENESARDDDAVTHAAAAGQYYRYPSLAHQIYQPTHHSAQIHTNISHVVINIIIVLHIRTQII